MLLITSLFRILDMKILLSITAVVFAIIKNFIIEYLTTISKQLKIIMRNTYVTLC